MRVERSQHAVQRGFDQLLVGDLLDILAADPLEDVAEQVEKPVGFGRVLFGRRETGNGRESQPHTGAAVIKRLRFIH